MTNIENVHFHLHKAIEWKVSAKEATFEATTADFVEAYTGTSHYARRVMKPVNQVSTVFTKADLDEVDIRLAPALLTLNDALKGPKRRREMAKAIRNSYFAWNHHNVLAVKEEEMLLCNLKFTAPSFKDPDDFYVIFHYLIPLHTPAKPLMLKNKTPATNDFNIMSFQRMEHKCNLNQTDIDTRDPGFRQRLAAVLALGASQWEVNKYVLHNTSQNHQLVFTENFMADIEFS